MDYLIFYKEWLRGAWRDPRQFFENRKIRECPCCGFKGIFVSAKRRGIREFRCPNCASRPRDRQIAHVIATPELSLINKRILHFAPEQWLFNKLKSEDGYVGGDIIKRRCANAHVDITNIQFPDEHFDVIICNHVLEHVQNDSTALRECFRVLSPDGYAIFTVPTEPNRLKTWEPPEGMTEKEIERICGWDHKRLYGLDLSDRLRSVGFHAQIIMFDESDQESYRFLDEPVFLASKNENTKYFTE